MVKRAAPATFDSNDLTLLRLEQWRSKATDARSKRLAKLRLCESTANETVDGQLFVYWRVTDKGRLLAKSALIAR